MIALRDGMDHAEDPAEELVDDEREKADADHEHDRQDRRGDPLFARRPGDAAQLRDDAAEEVAARERLGRSLLLFVHQWFTYRKDLAGRTGLEPATTVLETATLPIELPPSAGVVYLVSRCGLWQRQKRQYLLSSSRSVVFCLFFDVL